MLCQYYFKITCLLFNNESNVEQSTYYLLHFYPAHDLSRPPVYCDCSWSNFTFDSSNTDYASAAEKDFMWDAQSTWEPIMQVVSSH